MAEKSAEEQIEYWKEVWDDTKLEKYFVMEIIMKENNNFFSDDEDAFEFEEQYLDEIDEHMCAVVAELGIIISFYIIFPQLVGKLCKKR